MSAHRSALLHPLVLDDETGYSVLAGVAYLSARPLAARDGRSVVYLTEASQPEHLYKFIGPLPDGGALSHGTLYVARFGDAGHGRWLPLVLARHGLLPCDGYASAEAILANAIDAARSVGASRIDYLFGPQSRTDGGHLLLCDQASPALAWREAMGDAASLSFTWQGIDGAVRVETNFHGRRANIVAAPLRG